VTEIGQNLLDRKRKTRDLGSRGVAKELACLLQAQTATHWATFKHSGFRSPFFLWQTRLNRVLEEDKETVEALKDRIAELEKDIETQRDTILAQSAVNERFLQYFENVAECIQYYDEFVNELDSRLHQVETRVFSSASEAKPSFKERSY
jgi:hypothetical protein